MKHNKTNGTSLLTAMMALLVAFTIGIMPSLSFASGGSGSGGGGGTTAKVDSIKVSKCFYDAPTGQMLIKASSSDVTAHLYACRPDGTYQGEVQNGGSIIVPTTPFQI